jgi:hypothetical protein
MRKVMSYEKQMYAKLAALFSAFSKGLPRRDGSHITPERVRDLPYEYNDPHLQRVYHQLRHQYFPNRPDVDDYKVVWRDQPMQTKNGASSLYDTLAYIEYGTRTIHIGREMSHPDAVQWLAPLIHHELCHAILVEFLKPNDDAHAEWFMRINSQHPQADEFKQWHGWRNCYDSYHADKAPAPTPPKKASKA